MYNRDKQTINNQRLINVKNSYSVILRREKCDRSQPHIFLFHQGGMMRDKEETMPMEEQDFERKILHRDLDFLRFITNRPHYNVKYHRKRSPIVTYLGPTITKSQD